MLKGQTFIVCPFLFCKTMYYLNIPLIKFENIEYPVPSVNISTKRPYSHYTPLIPTIFFVTFRDSDIFHEKIR